MSYYARAHYTGDGATTQFALPFGYISQADIKVYEGPLAGPWPAWPGTFTFVTDALIQLSSAPAAARRVIVKRETPLNSPIATVTTGTLIPGVLNLLKLQSLYAEQELQDFDTALTLDELVITIPNPGILSVQTLTAARAIVTANAGLTGSSILTLVGHTSAGDRGNRHYRWSSASTAADDGASIIKPDDVSGGNPGRWLLIIPQGEALTPEMWGAVQDDATNVATALNAALTYGASIGRPIYIPAGTAHRATAAITPGTNAVLRGDHPENNLLAAVASILKSSATKAIDFGTGGVHSSILEDFRLMPVTADVASTYGIYGENTTFHQYKSLDIRDFATGIYHEKSQQHQFDRCYLRSNGIGVFFSADVGTYNVDWYANLMSFRDCTIIDSTAGPNIDFQGQGLRMENCDLTGITNTGTRASVRVRAGSYDTSFVNCYFEPVPGQTAGGDVFLIEGGRCLIDGCHIQGGASGTRVGSVVSAKSGAQVVIRGLIGFDFFTNYVKADGAGTVVYILPGAFEGSMDATTKLVETNNGKIIDLRATKQLASATTPTALTLTGCTTSPTGNIDYTLVNRTVTINIPTISGTSNTTAATLTGLPAEITPSANVYAGSVVVFDNSINALGEARIDSDGKITLFKDINAGGFTAAGVKGFRGQSLSWVLP